MKMEPLVWWIATVIMLPIYLVADIIKKDRYKLSTGKRKSTRR